MLAVGMSNGYLVGMTAILHPIVITKDIFVGLTTSTYHRRALHPMHTASHRLNSYMQDHNSL